MQLRQFDPFSHRRLLHRHAGRQKLPDLPEYPWTSIRRPTDHHAVHAVSLEHLGRFLPRVDIAVADDRNPHARIALHLADQRPVGLAPIHLGARAPVNRQRGDPRVLQPLGDLDDVLRILVPPQPRLDRHGQTDRLDDAARHLDHFWHVAHHAAAGSAPGDLAHRAAEIDVDQVGSGRLGHTGRLDHRFDLMAVKLNADRPLVIVQTELGHRLGRIADQPVARNELRVDHIGPEHLAHVTERRIGHVFHRREKQRLVAQIDSGNLHRRKSTKKIRSRRIPARNDTLLGPYPNGIREDFPTRTDSGQDRPYRGTVLTVLADKQLPLAAGRVCRRPPRRDFALKM